jgi:spoIIIJ-associated protein
MDEIIKITEEIVKNLLNLVGFESNVEVKQEAGAILVSIKQKEAGLLIGKNGEHLTALQHILRMMVFKRTGQVTPLILDIENYRQKQKNNLEKEAQEALQKVLKYKRAFVLRPMSSYERRVIHLALAESPEVVTESIGVEPNRRIIVRPK